MINKQFARFSIFCAGLLLVQYPCIRAAEAGSLDAQPGAQTAIAETGGRTEKTISKAQLDAERRDAILDEESAKPTVSRKYLRLAQNEADAEMPKEAIEDARHALRLYQRIFDSLGYVNGMLGIQSDLIESYNLGSQLAKTGHEREGEDLMHEAMQVTNKAFGPRSAAAANQLAQLFQFYIDQKRDEEALHLLDKLLKFDLRTIEVGNPSALKRVMESSHGLIHEKRHTLALKIYYKIVSAQKLFFDADDQRIAATLVEIAKAQDASNEIASAEETMLEAVAIYRKYVGDIRVIRPCQFLIELWKKMGRTEYAKTVKVDHQDVSPALLRQLGDTELAEQIERTGKLPESLVDPEYPHVNRKLYEHEQVLSTPMKVYEQDYKDACAKTPYSSWALASLQVLISESSKLKDWRRSCYYLEQRIKIHEHTTDQQAGRSWGCIRPKIHRIDDYNDLITTLMKMKKLDDAQRWIDRAEKDMPEITATEYTKLAEREMDLNGWSRAQNYALLAEQKVTNQHLEILPDEAVNIWRRTGKPAHADLLQKKADAYYRRCNEQTRRVQQNSAKGEV